MTPAPLFSRRRLLGLFLSVSAVAAPAWAADEAPDAFVRRFYSGAAPTGNSMWAVPGGPGDSTDSFDGFAQIAVEKDPTVTFYLLDPRGTGNSSLLTCDKQPGTTWNPANASSFQPWRECIQNLLDNHSADLAYYSMKYAAQDLHSVMTAVNPAKVAIYALSCGTYLLNTYLQIPDARADVVVLDGPVAPSRWSLQNGT